MCTLARSFARSLARSRGRERGAHAQFRRNKRELSRTREKHQKTCRAQSDGAARARGPQRGDGGGNTRLEGGSEIERWRKRDAVSIKGEA